MSNFAITGSSGYIGQLLRKRLEHHDGCKKVVGIDIKASDFKSSKCKFYNADIRDNRIGDIFEWEGIDTLIHLAFVFQPTHNIKEMNDINVNGAMNVLKNAKKYGIKRILIFSSTTAYGAHEDNPKFLTEESPLRGNRDFYYTHDKVEVEKICADFQRESRNIIFINIRPCIIFGPSINNHVSRYIDRPIVPLISGHNPDFQLVHEEDIINACMISLERNIGGSFNIVSKHPVPIKEIPSIVGRRLLELPYPAFYFMHELMWQLRIPIIETPASMSSLIRYRWVASGEKARTVLGFVPKYSTKDSLLDFCKKRMAN